MSEEKYQLKVSEVQNQLQLLTSSKFAKANTLQSMAHASYRSNMQQTARSPFNSQSQFNGGQGHEMLFSKKGSQ